MAGWLAAAIALQGLGGLVNAGCYLGHSPKAPAAVILSRRR